jgi:hypothetical protein
MPQEGHMKVFKWIAAGFAIAVLLLLTVVLGQLMVAHAPPKIEYFDLLMVVLTMLSIMITVLGLGLAVLGVIGWATFEAKLRDHSFSYFATELGKEGKLRRELEALIVETSLKGVESVDESSAPASTPPAEGDGEYVD